MNVLIKVSDSIPFCSDFDFVNIGSSPKLITSLAEHLGLDYDCNVVICANTGGLSKEEAGYFLLDSVKFEDCLKENEWDAFITCSDPSFLLHKHPYLKTRMKLDLAFWYKAFAPIPDDVKIVCFSEFQASTIKESNAYSKDIVVLPPVVFSEDIPHFDKAKNTFFYPSDEMAGLHRMRDIWELIIEQEPDSILKIPESCVSGAEGLKYSHFVDGERARKILELKKMSGVQIVENNVGYGGFVDYVCSSSCVVYPCDPIYPYEYTGSSVINSLALGVPVVCSDQDCLSDFSKEGMAITLPVEASPDIWATMCLGATKTFVVDRDKILDLYSVPSFVSFFYSSCFGELI